MSRCPRADYLRMVWYMSKSELDEVLLLAHVKYCPVCQKQLQADTAQARQAEMPEMESEE